jgi:hypothetical protein
MKSLAIAADSQWSAPKSATLKHLNAVAVRKLSPCHSHSDSQLTPSTASSSCHCFSLPSAIVLTGAHPNDYWLLVDSCTHARAHTLQSRSFFTTDGQSVSMSWCRAHTGTCDQILLPVGRLLSESCGLLSRPLWREDGSAICSAITQWSESRRTRNHTLLSHLRLPQPGGPGSLIHIPQQQGRPVILPGHWVLFKSPFTTVVVTLRLMVSQSVSRSVCLSIEHPCGTCDQILLPVVMLLSEICGLVSVGRPL